MWKSLTALSFVLSFLQWTNPAAAKNLTEYRRETNLDLAQSLSQRRAGLDKTLGVESLGLGNRIANDKVITDIRKGGVNSRSKDYTGTVLKLRFENTSRELRDLERYDPPLQFDPGKIPATLRADAANRRRDFCKKYFDAKIPGESRSNIELAASEYLTSISASVNGQVSKQISQQQMSALTAAVATHLNYISSKGFNISNLGKLESVAVNDGVVNRLNFRIGSQSLPISLSTLATSRTGTESAFMTLFGYFGERIDLAVNENKNIPSLGIYRAIRPRLVEDSKTALKVHQAVESLSSASKNVLISLLAHLQGDDLPVDEDFQTDENAESKSFALLVSSKTQSLTSTKSLSKQEYARLTSSVGEILADYRFYRLMHKQLSEVVEIVQEENARFAAVEAIKKEM
jgi:hypothetical protein